MKKLIIYTAILFAVSGIAQNKKNEFLKQPKHNLAATIFNNAIKYNDAGTAIQSIHHIIAEEGSNSTYKDSLAVLYFRSKIFISSHLVAKELLLQKPNDTVLLEINAVSLKSLGFTKEAIEAYEKLLAVSKNRFHAYELAQLQFGLGRLGEALVTVNQALSNTNVLNLKIMFELDKDRKQEVPLNAAIFNLKGVISFELKDEKLALEMFNEAIKIMPDFNTALINKKAIENKGSESTVPIQK